MIKLGVVGYGARIDAVVKGALREVDPDIRIVAVVDPNEEEVREKLADCDKKDVVFYKDIDEMVAKAKIDGIIIGTRCGMHTPMAMKAAKYDLPLYLEKPVSTSMEQAIALEKAFENAKCPVVVSFPLRVSPICVQARKKISNGAVGTPEHVLATNYVSYGTVYFDNFYRDFESTQGLFLQKATHDLDYISYLMDSNIVKVAAMWNRGRVFGGDKKAGLKCSECSEADTCLESPKNRKRNCSGGVLEDHACVFGEDCGTPGTGMNEDSSSVLMEFESGAHGLYTQVFYTRRDAAARGATISGYHGTVSFDWYTNEIKHVRHHKPFSDVTKADSGMSHFGGDYELAFDFIDIIKGREKSRTPIETGIQSAYVCLAAKESAEKGQFVAVRQVGQ